MVIEAESFVLFGCFCGAFGGVYQTSTVRLGDATDVSQSCLLQIERLEHAENAFRICWRRAKPHTYTSFSRALPARKSGVYVR